MYKEILDKLRLIFLKNLQTKTGWGRNQLMIEFDKSCIELLTKILDEKTNINKEN